jgi:hypothetical protein
MVPRETVKKEEKQGRGGGVPSKEVAPGQGQALFPGELWRGEWQLRAPPLGPESWGYRSLARRSCLRVAPRGYMRPGTLGAKWLF